MNHDIPFNHTAICALLWLMAVVALLNWFEVPLNAINTGVKGGECGCVCVCVCLCVCVIEPRGAEWRGDALSWPPLWLCLTAEPPSVSAGGPVAERPVLFFSRHSFTRNTWVVGELLSVPLQAFPSLSSLPLMRPRMGVVQSLLAGLRVCGTWTAILIVIS